MHGKKTWLITKDMPATIDVKLANKRAQLYYTARQNDSFFQKWKKWDLDKGMIEDIYFKFPHKDWYALFSTKHASINLPIACLYFDFQQDGEFINKKQEKLKWAQKGTSIPQNDGKGLEIDWGDCKSGFDSAASASDDNVDEYYQNIALNNFNNDAMNNQNIAQSGVASNEYHSHEHAAVTSDEYDGDVSTSEDEYYYNKYGLNHDVSLP